MRLDTSAHGIVLIVAVVVFVLAAIGLTLGTINLIAAGLAVFAASFLLR